MSTITWNNAVPAQADSANTVDDLLRSTVTSVAVGVGESFFWPGSAASAGASTASTGVMRPGAGRLSRASQRLVAYGDGYLSVSTIRNAVIHMGSTRTELVAHPMGYEWWHVARNPGSNGTNVALLQMGSFTTDQNQRTLLRVDFPRTFVSTNSITVLLQSSRSDVFGSVASTNASGFTSLLSQIGATGSSTVITWCALGMVTT